MPKRIARDLGGPRRASRHVRERASAEGSELARVRRTLEERGLAPRKRFGQNFLIHAEAAERIGEHSRVREDDVAVEIGPGLGALTARIAARARRLVAVELDAGLAEFLREEFAEWGKVEIEEADFLEVDLTAIAHAHGGERVAVVG